MNFQKVVFYSFFLLVFIFSCSNKEMTNNEILIGDWRDVSPIGQVVHTLDNDGNIVEINQTDFSKILLHLNDNGTYSIDEEFHRGLDSEGQWSYDEVLNVISFESDPSLQDVLGYEKVESFEIIELSETSLVVNFKQVWNKTISGDGFESELTRTFMKE